MMMMRRFLHSDCLTQWLTTKQVNPKEKIKTKGENPFLHDEKIEAGRRQWNQHPTKMITDMSTNVDLMVAKTEDVIMRLNSMLVYVKTMNEHAMNTPCSQDKVKEATINFFKQRIQELEENIQYAQAARNRLLDG